MKELCLVYVTASSKKEAEKIAKELVKGKLAACVNIFDKMTSYYMWEGKLEKASEAALIIKTKKSLLSRVEKKIKELHSYSCPCIIAMPIVHANRDFAKWIITQTK